MSKRSMISSLAARRDFSVPHKTHVLHRKDWFYNSDKFSIHNTLDCPELHGEIRKLKIMILWDTLIRRLQLIKLNKYH